MGHPVETRDTHLCMQGALAHACHDLGLASGRDAARENRQSSQDAIYLRGQRRQFDHNEQGVLSCSLTSHP